MSCGLWYVQGPNSTPYCVARVWAVNLPFTIMFATLLARMYRVWRLFAVKSAAFKSTVVRNKDLLRLVLLSAGVMGVRLPRRVAVPCNVTPPWPPLSRCC